MLKTNLLRNVVIYNIPKHIESLNQLLIRLEERICEPDVKSHWTEQEKENWLKSNSTAIMYDEKLHKYVGIDKAKLNYVSECGLMCNNEKTMMEYNYFFNVIMDVDFVTLDDGFIFEIDNDDLIDNDSIKIYVVNMNTGETSDDGNYSVEIIEHEERESLYFTIKVNEKGTYLLVIDHKQHNKYPNEHIRRHLCFEVE